MFKKIINRNSILFISKIAITLAILLFSYTTFKKYELEKIKAENIIKDTLLADSLSKVKVYPDIEISQIGLKKIVLKTKCINEKMKYNLKADFIDDLLEKKGKHFPISFSNYKEYLLINFIDNDNFKIISATIFLNNVTYIINEKNENIGITLDGEVDINKTNYAKISNWELNWSL